ncbi:MAG: hypothetical protein E7774_03650 [Bradyrhizobium sp.]|nr:MAG: hypothetical protein E7774_03650 [Bradyrhizobium sp.]
MAGRLAKQFEACGGGDCETVAHVHQIFIADESAPPSSPPPPIAENIEAARRQYPEAEYRLWDRAALRATIAQHFEPAAFDAFETLRPYAYKADLARYCLLYIYGGLYVDLGVRCMAPLRPPLGVAIAGFRDIAFQSSSSPAVAPGLIWAQPRQRAFRIAIDLIIDNCRSRFYGENPLYPTGPALMGRALVAAMAERTQESDAGDQWIGVTQLLTPQMERQRMCFVAPDKSLVGLKIKGHGGDLAHLGAVGTNNYNELWRQRIVYGESPDRQR